MTNRERIEAMDARQLAQFLYDLMKNGASICPEPGCDGFSCVDCMVDWLKAGNNPKKGDVRKLIGSDRPDSYYLVVQALDQKSKVMYVDGSFAWVSNEVFLVDEPTDMKANEFLQMVVENM